MPYLRKKASAVRGCRDNRPNAREQPIVSHQTSASNRPPHVATCLAALFGMFVTRWLTSRFVFSLYDVAHPWLRDIAVLASIAFLGAIALVALWRPNRLAGGRLAAAAGISLVLGTALVALGSLWKTASVLWAGAILADVGSGLTCLCACISCIRLPSLRLAPCVAIAYAGSYVVRPLFAAASPLAGIGAFGITSLATLCVALLPASTWLGSLSADAAAPAQNAITRPATYLPLRHPLFILLLVFEIVYGYATTAVAPKGAPEIFLLVACLFALACIGSFLPWAARNPDWLFVGSVLTVLGGMLVLPTGVAEAGDLGSTALQAGSGLFQMLAFFLLIDLGHRNEANSLVVVAWGSAAMSLGVVIGANAAKLLEPLAESAAAYGAQTAAVAFALAAASLILQRVFSIRDTLEGIEDASVAVVPPSSEAAIEDRCREIGSQAGLTTREQEVFALLARGRNSPFIQEALGISYNTARTHVRHIYEKCGFHTQQELIDAVDGRSG